MENNRFITIGSLNRYLKAKNDKDIHLQRLLIKGEIKDFKISGNNIYFTMMDEDASMRCMMFSQYQYRLKFMPQDGDVVIAEGSLSFYVKTGTYTFLAYALQRYGEGDAHQAFLALKDKLDKEGLFDSSIKKPLPKVIHHVGIVTSPTGDAIHDIISTINRRFPFMDATIYPAKVQGEDAPESLISALFKAFDNDELDVIIIARGGGSDEDLACFNDEMLARTIRLAKIPVVSGVGHEADITICDLVSDLRAPTPTGAAMMITPNKEDVLAQLMTNRIQLNQALTHRLDAYSYSLKQYELRCSQNNPLSRIHTLDKQYSILKTRLNMIHLFDNYDNRLKVAKERLNHSLKWGELESNLQNQKVRLNQAFSSVVNNYHHILEVDKIRNEANNPLNYLDKGYVLIEQNQHLINSIHDLNNNDFTIHFKDGQAFVETNNIKKINKSGK